MVDFFLKSSVSGVLHVW